MATDLIDPREAYNIASQWGSYMNASDPGAAFYTFKSGDATPRGENHRAQLLAYTESLLASDDLESDDREELESLKAFFTSYPHSGEEFRETYADETNALLATLDGFTKGYVTAAVFFGVEYPHGHPDADSDKNTDLAPSDVAPSALQSMIEDCTRFQQVNAALLAEAYSRPGYAGSDYTAEEMAGHDFWLTRNGHGAGFWDRSPLKAGDLGERLSTASKLAGESDLYTGDDGGVYAS